MGLAAPAFLEVKMRKRTVIIVPLVAVAVAGCSSEAVRSSDENVPSLRNPLDASSVSTPLDTYLPPSELTYTLHRAEVLLTNQCLRRLGYPDHPMPAPKERGRGPKHSEFLVFSMSQAAKLGYNTAMSSDPARDSSWDKKTTGVQRGLLDGTLKRYKGESVPKGGCTAVAADDLTVNSNVPKRLEGGGVELKQLQKASPTSLGDAQVGIIRLDAISATKKDLRYIGMVRAWSSCMSKMGYEYETPERARDDARWSGSVPSRAEKRTATADMACKKKVDYLAEASSIQSTYEEKVIEERKGELSELRRNLKVWQKNATRVIDRADG